MKQLRTLAVLATVLTWWSAGCAPSAAGTSPSRPVVVTDQEISLQRGTTAYLRLDYALDDLDLTPNDLRPVLWVPSGFAAEAGDVSTDFALRDLRLAPGWDVTLHQVRVERRSVSAGGPYVKDRVDYTVMALLRVIVPDGIVPGPYRIRGTLQERGGGAVPLAIRLDVTP